MVITSGPEANQGICGTSAQRGFESLTELFCFFVFCVLFFGVLVLGCWFWGLGFVGVLGCWGVGVLVLGFGFCLGCWFWGFWGVVFWGVGVGVLVLGFEGSAQNLKQHNKTTCDKPTCRAHSGDHNAPGDARSLAKGRSR